MHRLPAALFALILATPAHAAAWPVQIDVYYCWNIATPCGPGNGTVDSFLLEANGTGDEVNAGYTIRWRLNRPILMVRYDAFPNSIYEGRHIGNYCFEGTMTNSNGAAGTWSGCWTP